MSLQAKCTPDQLCPSGSSLIQRRQSSPRIILEETMPHNLIDDLVEASPNRRKFLKTIAAATAGVSALSMAGLKSAEAQTSTEIEVLQFALNLEYLEAEFYTYALTGKGIEAYGIGINGLANGSNPAS